MEKQMSDCQKYAYVTSNYRPENKDERTVWHIKFLCNQFPTLFFKNPSLDIETVDIYYPELDIAKKFRGMTIFAHALDVGYYGQCIRFVNQMQGHPDFLTALDLDEPETIKALHRLFDKKEEEKLPVFKRDKNRQTLRNRLMAVLSPKYLAEKMLNTQNETNFSGALKLNELRAAYRALVQAERKKASQEELLTQINVQDSGTLTLLKQITNPHSKDIRHRLLTAKLQQLLTPQNFIEQVRGKKQDYRSSWELTRDEQRRENAKQTETAKKTNEAEKKINQMPLSRPQQEKSGKEFQPEPQDVLFMWASQGRNK
ncbi:MAG: hypothetical protein IKY98_00155 [Alphaproteobacteria bacterium]|nr:hypothetical protein [Alphaproteobacteria bacterium]